MVIPQALRHEMIKRTQSSHLGIGASLRKARDVIYWPGMNAEIPKKVISDNGSQFVSEEIGKFCEGMGIQSQANISLSQSIKWKS